MAAQENAGVPTTSFYPLPEMPEPEHSHMAPSAFYNPSHILCVCMCVRACVRVGGCTCACMCVCLYNIMCLCAPVHVWMNTFRDC